MEQLSFYEFAKNFIKIKCGNTERHLNENELKEIEMLEAGYIPKLISTRRGLQILYIKKPNKFEL